MVTCSVKSTQCIMSSNADPDTDYYFDAGRRGTRRCSVDSSLRRWQRRLAAAASALAVGLAEKACVAPGWSSRRRSSPTPSCTACRGQLESSTTSSLNSSTPAAVWPLLWRHSIPRSCTAQVSTSLSVQPAVGLMPLLLFLDVVQPDVSNININNSPFRS